MKQNFDGEIQELATVIRTLSTKKQVIEFLEGILTPKELQEISQRLQIVKRLKKGETQRQIAADLGVGVATITRGSKEIQNGKFIYV
ncbi:MAG: YerC/YecD family TrpR-related protein [Candidatus Woesebacteria bacterium]